MSDAVARLMYPDGFAEAPPGTLQENPAEPQPEASSSTNATMQPGATPPQLAPRAQSKRQPMFKSKCPMKRPGQHNRSRMGMDPKTFQKLRDIDYYSANEVERN